MNNDYGIVYKMCRPRKDGFFIETSILYRICSARSPSQLPILNKTPYKCLKVISFHDLVILNSYCGGFLIGQIQEREKMKRNEIIFTLCMGGMLLVLTMMVLGLL